MSIKIRSALCAGCGRCAEVCPGSLIRMDARGKASIRRVRDCWGCASCIKECSAGAILFYLGADAGGRGGTLSVSREAEDGARQWKITAPDGTVRQITVNSRDSNRY